MKKNLKIMIDTSVWLDLAKDPRHLALLDVMLVLAERKKIKIALPEIIIEEFSRNKERVINLSRNSLFSDLKRIKDAVRQFSLVDTRDIMLSQLEQFQYQISVDGEAAAETVKLIENLFDMAEIIPLTDGLKARAANRALAKLAPFHRDKNGIGDALIIETDIDKLKQKKKNEILVFVTHNIHDFSDKGSDTRLPHRDFADIFNSDFSIYSTNIASILNQFFGDFVEDVAIEREFNQNSRLLSDLIEHEGKLHTQIWYGRKGGIIEAVEVGRSRRVTRAVWDAASVEERRAMILDEVWDGMLAAMKEAEARYPGELGPWTDFEWGMLNGKLSAIRWMLGDEWDMLDT
ncbi:PIN domain-containing protein [Roseococcus thiosulfatophilus]|uniref:PIN domain-containing protein n=1 Tax=Roseococcus thiosulfatophilus TaxID=35813 RepID=UPI001A8F5055|nr:PIN domain-containing protein [Roseococcus thiosulfatophilus]